MAKKITANFYTDIGYVDDSKAHSFVKKQLYGGYLYSGWGTRYPTKLKPDDLPDDYVPVSDIRKHGYLRVSGISDLAYYRSPFNNHWLRDDFLYIAYDGKKVKFEHPYYYADEYYWGNALATLIFEIEKRNPNINIEPIKQMMVEHYNAYADEYNSWDFHKPISHISKLEEVVHVELGR